MEKFHLVAKTLPGLEEVLAGEIRNVGGKDVKTGIRAVDFSGNLETIYKANYLSRTAIRILKEISSFNFKTIDDFYRKCREVKWDNFMDNSHSFVNYSTVNNSDIFRNSMFASLKMKDALVDHFKTRTGKRPEVSAENPDIIFHVHINHETCRISLDSSGESLHKRGYRVFQGKAPLNEALAAGMILLSGWNGKNDFIDPMCGSGTLPIEAALIARNIPPGKFREKFAFERWNDFDPWIFEKLKEEIKPVLFRNKIYASDISIRNLNEAKKNAQNAIVYDTINFKCADFRDLNLKAEDAIMMMNPPYGERIRQEGLNDLYDMIGEKLKHYYSGNTAWILTSSKDYINKVGLKASRKIDLLNGSIECKFYEFRLFSGKLRDNKTKG